MTATGLTDLTLTDVGVVPLLGLQPGSMLAFCGIADGSEGAVLPALGGAAYGSAAI
jgi:hypothetical protein